MEDPSIKDEANLSIQKLICSHCGAEYKEQDVFCGECGAQLKDEDRSDDHEEWSEEVAKKVNSASKWILALGFLFIVFGSFIGYQQKEITDEAIANLAQYEDSMVWPEPVNGKTVTVSELRDLVNFEYFSVFVLNYFLAFVMFVIYFWSKTSPFSAFVTALSIYVGVIVLNAVVEPATIVQGIILKIFVIVALANVIKAAVPTRGLKRRAA